MFKGITNAILLLVWEVKEHNGYAKERLDLLRESMRLQKEASAQVDDEAAIRDALDKTTGEAIDELEKRLEVLEKKVLLKHTR